MIKFSCKNCGQKISVPEVHAGKKGKCPKCKTIVVVAEINDDISLKPQGSDTDNLQYVQQPPEPELRLKKDFPTQTRFDGLSADGLNVTNESLLKPEIKEKPPERKLPWILNIFLYPTSMSGLINLGIFWILPILLGINAKFFPIKWPPHVFTCLSILAILFIGSYMYYYFKECIRDSALGEIRASGKTRDFLSNFSIPKDLLWQKRAIWQGNSYLVSAMKEILASVVIFWGPVAAYFIYRVFWKLNDADYHILRILAHLNEVIYLYNPRTDIIFWLLLGYGIFFFPMGLLAIIMFNSSSGYNPFLWIASILSTFFQYCSLVLFFCVLGWLVSRVVSSFQQSLFFSYLFAAAFIYLAMVAAHLLGRFYYLNSKKLNWEV